MTDERKFQTRGINHLALVCRDMAVTTEFYTKVLGFPLVKTIELAFDGGQHFFFDIGNGDSLAFFWFPNNPESVPGVTTPVEAPGVGEWHTAVGTMNHVAFDVAPEKFDEYYDALRAEGISIGPVLNHDNSTMGVSKSVTDDVFVRSFYFQDPDGNLLEFAAWTKKPVGEAKDIAIAPRTAADRLERIPSNA